MTTASQQLAAFAAALQLSDVPPDVLVRARLCIADTVGCGVHGAQLPWSRPAAQYAQQFGGGGRSSLFGTATTGLQAQHAAMANGVAIHAFEQDSLRFPGAGVHPGAALVPVIAALCEDTGADGAMALRAFVAGCEVLFRVGAASHHSSEKLGFHAPGLTGVYGAAVAAGVILGLSPQAMAWALGLAGSMSGGLLAFTKAREGAAVKRLHMGRACEAGIMAARLASMGMAGPETVLEGRFGYLEAFCRDGDPTLLTAGLGQAWETRRICLKRYACHVTAQAPLHALRNLMLEHHIAAADVAGLSLACSHKVVSHHDIRNPQDIMQGQYSVPFCLALGVHRDPLDPSCFDPSALEDPALMDLCRAVRLQEARDLPDAWSARLVVSLRDGRQLHAEATGFPGLPGQDLTADQAQARFERLCASLPQQAVQALYGRFQALEQQLEFPMPPVPVAA